MDNPTRPQGSNFAYGKDGHNDLLAPLPAFAHSSSPTYTARRQKESRSKGAMSRAQRLRRHSRRWFLYVGGSCISSKTFAPSRRCNRAVLFLLLLLNRHRGDGRFVKPAGMDACIVRGLGATSSCSFLRDAAVAATVEVRREKRNGDESKSVSGMGKIVHGDNTREIDSTRTVGSSLSLRVLLSNVAYCLHAGQRLLLLKHCGGKPKTRII